MRLPLEIKKISPNWSAANSAVYPPLGFLSFSENALGNGDEFGLYWPVGKESEEPLVVEMQHDAWSMSPAYSSLESFLLAAVQTEDWIEPPSIADDPKSPYACALSAREMIQNGRIEDAVGYLTTATDRLPEFGHAQWQLSRQYHRLGNVTGAFFAARNAAIASPSFGGACSEAVAWLRRQASCPIEFSKDPLWRHRNDLSFKFGGRKENPDYSVIREMIMEYKEGGHAVEAIQLLQSYGELICRETVSFRQRYGFEEAAHIEEYFNLCMAFGMNRKISSAAL